MDSEHQGADTQYNSGAGDMQGDQGEATESSGAWHGQPHEGKQPTTTPDEPTMRPHGSGPGGASTNDQYEASAGMGDERLDDPSLRRRNLEEAMAPRHKATSHKSQQPSGNTSKPQSDAESQNTNENNAPSTNP